MKKLFAVTAALTLWLSAAVPPRAAGQGGRPARAPQGKFRRSTHPIFNSYIVVLDDRSAGERGDHSRAPALADELAADYGVHVEEVYRHALQGFAARMSEAAAVAVSSDPRVAYVQEDGRLYNVSAQGGTPWGLDRIDQRALPLDTLFVNPYPYGGPTVNVYVLDTGIRISHVEFGGTAVVARDTVDDDGADGNNNVDKNGQDGLDCNGHGTHVAGIIGATTYGAARGAAKLHSVRVTDCDDSTTIKWLAAGVNWVANNRVKPAVANMSFNIPPASLLDDAVRNLIASGVTAVVAAGNLNTDACNSSPARVGGAITVGASTSADARAFFSNYGTCVDIFAPGAGILSTYYTSNTATVYGDGTSQAAPHVAGVAARYLRRDPTATVAEVRDAILNKATLNTLNAGTLGAGSPNRLLYALLTPTLTDPGGTPAHWSSVTGTLAGAGDADYYPFTEIRGSIIQATLRGPAGTDFDLLLQEWDGTRWVTRSVSTGTNSYEVAGFGVLGNYRWVVHSYAGSGSYTLWIYD